MLLIPLLAVICGYVALFIGSMIPVGDGFSLMSWFLFAGCIGGAFLGDYMSKTIVRRNRIRSRNRCTCYRCNECSKVFLYTEKVEN